MVGKEIVGVVMAYLLGGLCMGYYLVRIYAQMDIRTVGSGGVGARNVGRVLGRPGFVVTLLGDALKGGLVLALARGFGMAGPALSFVLLAVIAGHIWPLQLQFRGGRGIAASVGAYLALDPYLALLLLGLTLVLLIFRRGFVLSGLVAFLLLPLVAFVLEMRGYTIAALAGSAIMILFAHREYIRKAFLENLLKA